MATETASLSPSQRRVLETLKRHGEATADELAAALDTTPSAVRQHLAALRSAGFVSSTPARGHAGRPADRYHATASSDHLFAAGPEFSIQLLELIAEEDPELLDRVFDRQRERMAARVGEGLVDDPGDAGIGERVEAIAERLDAEGYLAQSEATDDGRFLLQLHNCPIWPVADRYPQACTAELGVVQDLLPNATVSRSCHKTASTHTCTYEIEPAD